MTASDLTAWLPWTDRAGRTSWIKLVTFLAMLAPAVWMLTEWRMGWLSPKPVTDLVRESGDWAMRILILSLAVTPLRYVARFNRVILVRRMVGLAALFYTLAHIALWCVDPALLDALEAKVDRNTALTVVHTEGALYVTVGEATLQGTVRVSPLVEPA